MRFTLGADELASAVSYAAKVIASRPVQPVLAGLVIKAHEGMVTVHGMNDGIAASAQASVPANVSEDGVALVHGRLFSEICASVKTGTLEVFTEDAKLRVLAGKAKFNLSLMPTQDYPKALADADTVAGTIATAALVDAVDKVAFAADVDSAMPLLGGVHIQFGPKQVSLVATDRYRMAHMRVAWDAKLTGTVAITVPAKQLADAVRGLAKDGETIQIGLVGQDQVVLTGQSRTAKLGTLAGEYPAVLSLIPKAYTGTATLDARSALEVLNRVAVVAEKNDPVVLSFAQGLLAFRCGRHDDTAGSDEIEVAYQGPDMPVHFNPHYLKEGLAACGGSTTSVRLVAPAKPVVLTPVDNEDYTYLVMAVKPPTPVG